MNVWAIVYFPKLFDEELYQLTLPLVPDASERIKKFYRREDACRTLLGRLAIRLVLKDRGVAPREMTFNVTGTGKPYITTPNLTPSVQFNIAHDNHLVAVAFNPIENLYHLGIDVMKVQIPSRETFLSFVQTLSSQLTKLEQRSLFSVSQDEALKLFFWMWTMKEAYTKALSIGLGFDFSRIEYDVAMDLVRVDGATPKGWRFSKFILDQEDGLYQGVVAEYLGDDVDTFVVSETELHPWLSVISATEIARRASKELYG